MDINTLYDFADEIEKSKEFLFVIFDELDEKEPRVGMDVLDWESEDAVDGGWFESLEDAYEFMKEFTGDENE